MPKYLPISALKKLAKDQGLQQVIVIAWDGDRQHVATFGVTPDQCAQAAEAGNALKRQYGWPEKLCKSEPRRVTKLLKELKQALEKSK